MKLNDENLEREEIERATTRRRELPAMEGKLSESGYPMEGSRKKAVFKAADGGKESTRWKERPQSSRWRRESACMLGKKAADGKKAYVFIRST